jgi:hypothetical protein
MVEADSHLKLLPTSILDMYNVFEHIDMLSMSIQYQPYTVIPTLLLGSDFGVDWFSSCVEQYSTLLYQKLFFKCSTSLHNIL